MTAGTLTRTVGTLRTSPFRTDGEGATAMKIKVSNDAIRCDPDAYRRRGFDYEWTTLTSTARGEVVCRADFYNDPEAGPGHVRALAAEVRSVNGTWQMRLRATVIDDVGEVHAGTVGKHYKELGSLSSAKMQGTRNVHRFARGEEMPFLPDAEAYAWQPGDWVIDAAGAVWVRASEADAADGRPWGKPLAAARRQRGTRSVVVVPSGRTGSDSVAEPLTLLVRDGYPVQLH